MKDNEEKEKVLTEEQMLEQIKPMWEKYWKKVMPFEQYEAQVKKQIKSYYALQPEERNVFLQTHTEGTVVRFMDQLDKLKKEKQEE